MMISKGLSPSFARRLAASIARRWASVMLPLAIAKCNARSSMSDSLTSSFAKLAPLNSTTSSTYLFSLLCQTRLILVGRGIQVDGLDTRSDAIGKSCLWSRKLGMQMCGRVDLRNSGLARPSRVSMRPRAKQRPQPAARFLTAAKDRSQYLCFGRSLQDRHGYNVHRSRIFVAILLRDPRHEQNGEMAV